MQRKRYLTPLTWPAISFAAMILLGTLALCLPVCHGEGASLSVVDAAFLSTSAVCVTGLSPVDISQVLSPVGQGVMLVLIQVGGLGVMTYTSLIFLLWRKQVPFTSREAVSQALLGGDFNMGQFLLQVVCIVLGVELLAALVLFLHDPVFFSPFSALFHAVSAFCNAGFALAPDNMVAFREDGLVCTVICICIVLGGIGFGVLRECLGILSRGRLAPVTRLSRLSHLHHMDHSPAYRQTLARFSPDWKLQERRLTAFWRDLPVWARPCPSPAPDKEAGRTALQAQDSPV